MKWWGPRELSGEREKLTLGSWALGPLTPVGEASSYPSPSSLPLPAGFSPESLPITSSWPREEAMSQIPRVAWQFLGSMPLGSLKRLRSLHFLSLGRQLLHKRPDYSESTMLGGSQATWGSHVKALQSVHLIFKSSQPRCQPCKWLNWFQFLAITSTSDTESPQQQPQMSWGRVKSPLCLSNSLAYTIHGHNKMVVSLNH